MVTPNHKMCILSSTSKSKPVFFQKEAKKVLFLFHIFFVLFAKQFFFPSSLFMALIGCDNRHISKTIYFMTWKQKGSQGKKWSKVKTLGEKSRGGITERDWSKDVWLGNYKSDQNLILKMRLFHSWQYQN